MAKRYERLSKDDLAVATPVGTDNLRGFDLVKATDITDETDVLTPVSADNGPRHEHIYSGRNKSPILKSADIAIKRMYFGREFLGENPTDEFESYAQARAKYLGKAFVGRAVYVVAYEPADMVNNDNPDYFAATVVSMIPVPSGGGDVCRTCR